MYFEKIECEGVDLILVSHCCERGDATLGSIKGNRVFEQLSHYRVFKNNCGFMELHILN
jgi:hypothetical protein